MNKLTEEKIEEFMDRFRNILIDELLDEDQTSEWLADLSIAILEKKFS